eukprot:jgi/Bigna1/64001/fgenesh1_kg.65_\
MVVATSASMVSFFLLSLLFPPGCRGPWVSFGLLIVVLVPVTLLIFGDWSVGFAVPGEGYERFMKEEGVKLPGWATGI